MIRRSAFLVIAVLLFFPDTASAKKKIPDTGGSRLIKVWTKARRKYSDAMFISVSGRTLSTGLPVCDPNDPFRNGWRFTFYSPKKKKFLMMAECGDVVAGPLVQMRDRRASKLSIEGKFIDSDVALKTLARAGVSLDPADHKVRSRRPFLLSLYRLEDDRFESHPVVWKIRIGKKSYLVDAVNNELFSPKRFGVSLRVEVSTGAYASEILSKRPKRANTYTAGKDLVKVKRYAKKYFKGARLMGIEGFSDAWGGSPCTGAGDGWAYYYYYPKRRSFEAIYACDGQIGPGPSQYIPIDLNLHEPITEVFQDSNKIMDNLIVAYPSVMNEGMGRNFTRNSRMLLLQFRASPIAQAGMWKVRLIWRVTIGRTRYRFDGNTGTLIDSSE